MRRQDDDDMVYISVRDRNGQKQPTLEITTKQSAARAGIRAFEEHQPDKPEHKENAPQPVESPWSCWQCEYVVPNLLPNVRVKVLEAMQPYWEESFAVSENPFEFKFCFSSINII